MSQNLNVFKNHLNNLLTIQILTFQSRHVSILLSFCSKHIPLTKRHVKRQHQEWPIWFQNTGWPFLWNRSKIAKQWAELSLRVCWIPPPEAGCGGQETRSTVENNMVLTSAVARIEQGRKRTQRRDNPGKTSMRKW
jgi:hypothetical protein